MTTTTTRDAPRTSTDTSRHLLSESTAPSLASAASSLYTNDTNDITDDDNHSGERTPRAASPARQTQTRHASIAAPEAARTHSAYRGFASEEAYLDALRAWAEERRFAQPTGTTLVGFYGATTMGEIASRPAAFSGAGLGLKRRWKARKASKDVERSGDVQGGGRGAGERRATVA